MKIISKQYIIPTLAVLGLLAYATLFYTGHPEAGRWVLMSVLIAGTLPLLWKMARDILRGHFGVDLIAMVAIVVAFVLGEYLAGAVIVLMLSGGEALEEYALNRSSRELTKLLSRAPSVAHVKLQDKIVDVKASEVKPEDLLLVKKGEIIPVDGLVINGESEVDEASITGEPLPVRKEAGSLLYSGSINEDNVLEYRATKHAHESQYERIVKLVKQAQESRAPVVRLADRYAVGFTLVSFVIAFGAYFFYRKRE
jgi:cation transport ATPase